MSRNQMKYLQFDYHLHKQVITTVTSQYPSNPLLPMLPALPPQSYPSGGSPTPRTVLVVFGPPPPDLQRPTTSAHHLHSGSYFPLHTQWLAPYILNHPMHQTVQMMLGNPIGMYSPHVYNLLMQKIHGQSAPHIQLSISL